MIGARWHDAAEASKNPSREATLARRRNAIGPEFMTRIVVPTALAWLDRNEGAAPPAGHFGLRAASAEQNPKTQLVAPRMVRPSAAPARTPPPAWVDTHVERAAEAIVIGTAREGFRIGATCTVAAWRRGWAGYAEMGAIAWRAMQDPRAQIDTATWGAMERAADEGHLAAHSAQPALEATSALVMKMLEQTARNHVAGASDERTLCALETPARLWRALRDAGPCPDADDGLDLNDRWWLVEVEDQADDEPNAVAL